MVDAVTWSVTKVGKSGATNVSRWSPRWSTFRSLTVIPWLVVDYITHSDNSSRGNPPSLHSLQFVSSEIATPHILAATNNLAQSKLSLTAGWKGRTNLECMAAV